MQNVLFELLERLFSDSKLQEPLSIDGIQALSSVAHQFEHLLSEEPETKLVYCGLNDHNLMDRFFSPEELFILGADGAQLVNWLVKLRIITPQQRELVLQQASMESEDLSLEEIKELIFAVIVETMNPIRAVWLESILFHEQSHLYTH